MADGSLTTGEVAMAKPRKESRTRTAEDDAALVNLAIEWSASLKLYNQDGQRYLWLQFSHA